jgi:hypothetical protein
MKRYWILDAGYSIIVEEDLAFIEHPVSARSAYPASGG